MKDTGNRIFLFINYNSIVRLVKIDCVIIRMRCILYENYKKEL